MDGEVRSRPWHGAARAMALLAGSTSHGLACQVHTLQWMGLRTHVSMQYDPRNRAKALGKEGSSGSQFNYDEVVTVKLAKGVGRRAALGRAQAIKAGIPEEGLEVPLRHRPACNRTPPPSRKPS